MKRKAYSLLCLLCSLSAYSAAFENLDFEQANTNNITDICAPNHCFYGSLSDCLATTNFGLASMWTRYTQWRTETLALGETLGDCLLRTANDTNQFPNGGRRSLAIMGDPTLRLLSVAPASNLAAITNGGSILLTWTASSEISAQYLVYRSTNGLGGTFAPLTTAPIFGVTYTDASPPSGQKMYQVRALNLVIAGSGSYTNVSQGAFVISN